MSNKRITDLEYLETTEMHSGNVMMMVDSSGRTVQATVHQITQYAEPVIIKCQSCGQWGAKKTVCKHCGGPIG